MGLARDDGRGWLNIASKFALVVLMALPASAEAFVKSVEYVEISLGNGDTMSSVGLTKGQTIANCVPFASLMTAGVDDDFDQLFTDVYFEAGPQVTAERNASGGTVDLGVYVVEFDPTYVSVQQNVTEVTLAGTSTTTGVTSVDLAKAAMVFYYRGSFASHEWRDQTVAGWFSADDTLSFQRDGSDGNIYIHWYVFEALNSEFSVQPVSLSISGGSDFDTASITSVDLTKSFVIGSYRNAYDDDNVRSAATVIYLSSATQVRAERDYDSGLGISDIRAFVVTLSGSASVERGTLSYSDSGTQDTATVSSVSTTDSIVWNGMSTGAGVIKSADGSSSDTETAFHRIKLTDATTVQGDRGQASGDGTYPGDGVGRFEVVDFSGLIPAGPTTTLYRSIGITAAALESGTTNALTISGSTATFATGLADNIGVGDAIQYDSDGNSTIDAIAFIHGRTSSTEYTVKDAAGSDPTAVVGDNDWSLFRAYTSLSSWEALNENSTISATVRDFDTSTDLVAADTTMHAACYDDGPINDMVDVSGWVTGPSNYIRIFTPTSKSEVGASQRHTGTAGTGFRMTPTASGAGYQIINLNTGYVRVEGLELDGAGLTNALYARGIRVPDGLSNVGDIRLEANVIHDLHTTQNGYMWEGSMGIIDLQGADLQGPPMRVSNNIIYDVTNTVNVGHIAGILIGSRATSYVYNNTVHSIINTGAACAPDCGPAWGIYSKAFGGGTVDVIATNNFCGSVSAVNPTVRCYDTQSGSGLTQSYNVSSDNSASGTGSQIDKTAYATYFVNVAPTSEDLHIVDSSINLWGSNGTDLSGDANLPVTNDIDAETRGRPDIGADEYLTPYSFRKRITIDRGQISDPSCGATLTNYPMLFNSIDPDLRHTGSGGDVTDLGGDDIIFQAFDTTTCGGATACRLDHEIEKYDNTTGELVAWVRIPGLNTAMAASDTEIFVTYGNPSVTSPTENPTGVWDANFKAVYHLDETVADEGSAVDAHVDSSGTNNHGDQNGNAPIAGMIGTGQDFDGNDFILGTTTGFVTTGGTIAFWFKGHWAANDSQIHDLYTMAVTDWDTNAMAVKKHSTNEFQWYVADDSPNDYRLRTINPVAWPAEEWHHVTATWDASLNVEMYVDAVRIVNPWWDVGSPGLPTAIAPTFRLGNTSPNAVIDEFQYSDIARHACWAAASYNNQAWPDKTATPAPIPPNVTEGFYGLGPPTAVELVSFTAHGLDGAVELHWETGSELDNLGFHLDRATSVSGPWERVTSTLIPGLGSSPAGARYRYVDARVTNDVTYYYVLEDVETTGATERHGPVGATPASGLGDGSGDVASAEDESDVPARITYGEPEANALRVRPHRNGVMLELTTRGFVAVAQRDGSVRLEVPGLEEVLGSSLPVKRTSLEALAGKDVKVASSRAYEVERFAGLRPSASLERDVEASPSGTVRARLRRRGRRLLQREGAKLVEVGYQGEVKKALVELSPFAWDGTGLVVAQKLEVYVAFRGREAKRVRTTGSKASVRLVAKEKGLYGVELTQLFGARRASKVRALRLSRQGHDVAYHLEAGTLYFWSEGASANPYSNESVYELEVGVVGERMEIADASSATSAYYMETLELEENRYYQSTLLDAPDLWLWEVLFAPERKSFDFDVSALSPEPVSSSLDVWIQGASDFPAVEDHHVRVYVNGSYVGEGRWDGKTAHRVEAELGVGILREGRNTLELESLSDTGAAQSMVMVDRFRIRYPRATTVLERAAHVIELTDSSPRWVASRTGFEAMGSYVAVDEVRLPERRSVARSRLRQKRQADYLVIGPEALVAAAKPLLRHRRREGLRTTTATTDAIASEFGHGELTPDAIRELIGYAYHEWRAPRLRYVLLLGDATYDFKNYLGTDVTNQVPPFIVRTSYLWTASDPAYAAVNGDDLLPDVAIGRLPAKSPEELRAMVAKILAYENGELNLNGKEEAPFVLVADNADEAGNFQQDADELASTLLAGRETKQIYLSQLGTFAAREAIAESFDRGASTVSYLGHGAINFWADENIFNNARVETLSPQSHQPLLLTMNCLNGYFHFPYFDSLAETLVKQKDKGAIAAFSPSGLSLNGPAHRYHQAVLQQLLSMDHARLGDALLAAQKQYADTGAFPELLSIYHLFGDPALTLR